MNDRADTLAQEAASSRVRALPDWADQAPTALLVLADGTVIEGRGAGATGIAVGEVCFNTAMTGYQEILTDPSYAGQIITFTFPHIGNVGTNDEDMESASLAAGGVRGCVLRALYHSAVQLARQPASRRCGSRRAASSPSPASTRAR